MSASIICWPILPILNMFDAKVEKYMKGFAAPEAAIVQSARLEGATPHLYPR